MVLIGDALHSAHFSIGSGTRLAIEDAIALVKALESEADIPAALARYESERKPIVKKLVTAARTSADWYEKFPEHMKLDLMDFAYSYITRSGRIDDARLRAMSPRFMARYEAAKRRRRHVMAHEIADGVPRDCAGAREIGFAMPERYNASRVLFDNLAKGFGDRLALTGPAGRRTYAELCAEACRWGNGFASLGLQRGDRVLLFLDDTPVYPAAFFGAVRAGFVPLLINTLTPPELLQFYLADSGAHDRGRRCRVLLALRRRGLQGHGAAHARRGQWRHRRSRAPESDRGRAMADGFSGRARGSRHPSQRNGILDVFVGLDRTAQGHRPSAA